MFIRWYGDIVQHGDAECVSSDAPKLWTISTMNHHVADWEVWETTFGRLVHQSISSGGFLYVFVP